MDSDHDRNAKSATGGKALAPLVYNGEVIHHRDETLSLTDMWKAAGSPSGRAPNDWRALQSSVDFSDHVASMLNAGKSGNDLYRVQRGGKTPGTLAHWQIGLAYAKYLSPEFHMWANTVVRERMTGSGPHRDSLPPADMELLRSLHGMMRMVAHKVTVIEHAPPMAPVLSAEALDRMVDAAVSRKFHAVRNGRTAGQVLVEAGFPRVKGLAPWLGNVFAKLGFQIADQGCGELGLVKARLFDPDKVAIWLKNGGRVVIERKVAERTGQQKLRLVPPAA